MTADEFKSFCKDICPCCAADAPTRQRTDTLEFVHDKAADMPGIRGKVQTHTFCLASHFRNKWGDRLSG